MATCFDRRTVIISPIKSIFKEPQSEHSMGSLYKNLISSLRRIVWILFCVIREAWDVTGIFMFA